MEAKVVYATLVLISVAMMGVVAAVPWAGSESEANTSFSLQFVRTGGFAGVNDVLTIDQSGAVSYVTRFGHSFNASMSQSDLVNLKKATVAGLSAIQTNAFQPKNGVADFFTYGLTVTADGKTTQVTWVDPWASSVPLPAELQSVHLLLQTTIQSLSPR